MRQQANRESIRFAQHLVSAVKCGGFGFTQRQVAGLLGVSQATISRWGEGKVPMPLWAALALATLQGPLYEPAKAWGTFTSQLSFHTLTERRAVEKFTTKHHR